MHYQAMWTKFMIPLRSLISIKAMLRCMLIRVLMISRLVIMNHCRTCLNRSILTPLKIFTRIPLQRSWWRWKIWLAAWAIIRVAKDLQILVNYKYPRMTVHQICTMNSLTAIHMCTICKKKRIHQVFRVMVNTMNSKTLIWSKSQMIFSWRISIKFFSDKSTWDLILIVHLRARKEIRRNIKIIRSTIAGSILIKICLDKQET